MITAEKFGLSVERTENGFLVEYADRDGRHMKHVFNTLDGAKTHVDFLLDLGLHRYPFSA